MRLNGFETDSEGTDMPAASFHLGEHIRRRIKKGASFSTTVFYRFVINKFLWCKGVYILEASKL